MYNDDTYFRNNPSWHQDDSFWKASVIEGILEKNEVSFQSLAELGCGFGLILSILSKTYKNADLFGFDVSERALEECRSYETGKLSFHNMANLSRFENFDVILLIDVIEHVRDFYSFLFEAGNKSEFQVFHIPLDMNVNAVARNKISEYRSTVGHVHYFSFETALSALMDSNFEIIDYEFTPHFKEVKQKSLLALLIRPIRSAAFWISPKLCSRFIGGVSLLVLTKFKVS